MTKDTQKNSHYVPIKNYIYTLLSIIAVALLAWYIYSWHKVKESEKYIDSYLMTTSTITYQMKSLDEIDQILIESPNEYFVYISYTQDKDIYNLEQDLKKLIDRYELKDELYFLDATKLKREKNFIQDLNDTFSTTQIKNIPTIIYINGGEVKDVLNSTNDDLFESEEFENILKENGYEEKDNL